MPNTKPFIHHAVAVLLSAGFAMWATSVQAQVFALAPETDGISVNSTAEPNRAMREESDVTPAIPARLRRQVVEYFTREVPGTIIIDTPHTFLYFVLGDGKAIRYGIGVGREGYTWSGVKTIVRKTEWPDWYPPVEMVERQPYLPRMMAGGRGNPLGARALYIGGTEYRIHGTNAPASIGKHMSSGCIRLTNENIVDLYSRVKVGARVIVLPISLTHVSSASRDNQPPESTAPATVANTGGLRGLY